MRHFVLFKKPGLVISYRQLRAPLGLFTRGRVTLCRVNLDDRVTLLDYLGSLSHMLDRVLLGAMMPLHGVYKFCSQQLL